MAGNRSIQRSGGNGGRSFVHAARRILPALANVAARYAKRRMSTDTHVSEKGETAATTGQHDETLVYKRKAKKHSKKSKKIKKFQSRVLKAMESFSGTQIVKFSFAKYANTGNSTQQLLTTGLNLYSWYGSAVTPERELYTVFNQVAPQIPGTDVTIGAGSTLNWQQLIVESAWMHVMVTNTNTFSSGSQSVHCNVYEYVCRNDVIDGASIAGTLTTAAPYGAGDTSLTAADIGVGPFQFPQFCRAFIIKSVKRYVIPSGGMIEFDMACKKTLRIRGSDFINATAGAMPCRKGWTRGYVLQLTGEAYANGGGTPYYSGFNNVSVMVEKIYKVKTLNSRPDEADKVS